MTNKKEISKKIQIAQYNLSKEKIRAATKENNALWVLYDPKDDCFLLVEGSNEVKLIISNEHFLEDVVNIVCFYADNIF